MPSARSTTGKLQLGLRGDTSQAGCWSLGRRPNAAKAGWLGEEQQPLKWQHMEGAPLSPTFRQAWVDTMQTLWKTAESIYDKGRAKKQTEGAGTWRISRSSGRDLDSGCTHW